MEITMNYQMLNTWKRLLNIIMPHLLVTATSGFNGAENFMRFNMTSTARSVHWSLNINPIPYTVLKDYLSLEITVGTKNPYAVLYNLIYHDGPATQTVFSDSAHIDDTDKVFSLYAYMCPNCPAFPAWVKFLGMNGIDTKMSYDDLCLAPMPIPDNMEYTMLRWSEVSTQMFKGPNGLYKADVQWEKISIRPLPDKANVEVKVEMEKEPEQAESSELWTVTHLNMLQSCFLHLKEFCNIIEAPYLRDNGWYRPTYTIDDSTNPCVKITFGRTTPGNNIARVEIEIHHDFVIFTALQNGHDIAETRAPNTDTNTFRKVFTIYSEYLSSGKFSLNGDILR